MAIFTAAFVVFIGSFTEMPKQTKFISFSTFFQTDYNNPIIYQTMPYKEHSSQGTVKSRNSHSQVSPLS